MLSYFWLFRLTWVVSWTLRPLTRGEIGTSYITKTTQEQWMCCHYTVTIPRSWPKFYLRVFSLGFGSRQMFPIRKERLSRISCRTTNVNHLLSLDFFNKLKQPVKPFQVTDKVPLQLDFICNPVTTLTKSRYK